MDDGPPLLVDDSSDSSGSELGAPLLGDSEDDSSDSDLEWPEDCSDCSACSDSDELGTARRSATQQPSFELLLGTGVGGWRVPQYVSQQHMVVARSWASTFGILANDDADADDADQHGTRSLKSIYTNSRSTALAAVNITN